MNIFQLQCKGFLPSADKPSYHEQWLAGNYVVAGVFPITDKNPTPSQIPKDMPQLLKQTKKQKKTKLPHFMFMYFLVPIYCAESFSAETIDLVQQRRLHWGYWHYPVLFNTKTNDIHCYQNWGIIGYAFFSFLQKFIFVSVCEVSKEHGFKTAPTLDGGHFCFRSPRNF